jgi:hypothetical protein
LFRAGATTAIEEAEVVGEVGGVVIRAGDDVLEP